MAVMIIDIDHFKRLTILAVTLWGMNVFGALHKRYTYIVRGREIWLFVMGRVCCLLTDTDCGGSRSVAQLIRYEVERIQYRYDGTVVDLSVSIGIATMIPSDEVAAKNLLQQADNALY